MLLKAHKRTEREIPEQMLSYFIFRDVYSCFGLMMLQEGNRIKLAAAALPNNLFEWIKLSKKFGWGMSKHQPMGGRLPGQSVPALNTDSS